jgi:hypothetical protein
LFIGNEKEKQAPSTHSGKAVPDVPSSRSSDNFKVPLAYSVSIEVSSFSSSSDEGNTTSSCGCKAGVNDGILGAIKWRLNVPDE